MRSFTTPNGRGPRRCLESNFWNTNYTNDIVSFKNTTGNHTESTSFQTVTLSNVTTVAL